MGLRMIPVYKPWITDAEKNVVNEIMESGWVSSRGPYISRFEESFAIYLGGRVHCVAVCNGTAACHLALLGAGVTEDSKVIVPDLTFIATHNAIHYCKAEALISDVDAFTWNLDIDTIAEKYLVEATHLFLVHLYGNPCNMDRIKEVCKNYDIKIVEDACEAIGTSFNGEMAGTFGETAAFSFYGNKTITTGEGGMVVCRSKEVADRVRLLAGQYQTLEYLHPGIGYNYRMTNIQAGIGYSQIIRIQEILKEKERVWESYRDFLPARYRTGLQYITEGGVHGKWMVAVKVPATTNVQDVRKRLLDKGIESRGSFRPVSKQSFLEELPNSSELGSRIVVLPSHPTLTDSEIKYICDIL